MESRPLTVFRQDRTMLPMRKTTASIYDFPTYYDLVFGSDTAAELKFLRGCLERYAAGKVRRVFEPACGTGRLLYRLGQQGFEVGGIDLNPKAVKYCNTRLKRMGLRGRVQLGDMSTFDVAKVYDAAFNTINSFRHLQSEDAARAHLQCVARAVRPGGIYLLGIHLTPTRGEATDYESWSARRGQLSINTYMWPIDKNPRKRLERFGIRFDVYKPSESLRIEDVLELRSYTRRQFMDLLQAVSSWELMKFYDFGYDLDQPITVGPETEDVVAVLRRVAVS